MTSKFLTTATQRSATSAPPSKDTGLDWNPKNFMKRAVKFLLEHAAAALFLDPGLGKTAITLAAISFLFKKNMCQGWVVVAPRRPARLTWTREVKKWKDFQHLDLVLLHGEGKELLARERHQIYVVTYDGMEWLIKSNILRDWMRKGWVDGIVFDELQKVKHTDTVRYRTISKWLPRFDRRWGLTGSPAANGLLDLFGQCKTLDMGKALGNFVTHYRAQFFQPSGDYGFEPAPGADKLIYERLKPLALRMAAEDYLELPKRNVVPIYYDIPDELYSRYVELEEDYFTIVNKETIRAPNAGVASAKLRQFCSGAIYRQEIDELTGAPKARKSTDYVEIHDAKLEAFHDLKDELQGQQLLVAYEFKHDIMRIAEYSKRALVDMPFIAGGVSDRRGEELQDLWNRQRINELYVHPASASLGLNLQEGSAYNIAFFTMTWNLEWFDQLIRRLQRQGSTAKMVNIYNFIGRVKGQNTIDHRVNRAIIRKDATQDALFKAIQDRRAKEVDYDTDYNERLFAANMVRVNARKSAARKKAAMVK